MRHDDDGCSDVVAGPGSGGGSYRRGKVLYPGRAAAAVGAPSGVRSVATVWRPWWTGWRFLQLDLTWPVQQAVVAISSIGGGRCEAGFLVPVASWEDIVAGENRADGRRWRRSASLP